ncbi:unnamed protein product, partial [Effrenium voratum]
DAERALLDRMQAAAGARLVSLEHDGVAVYADAAERVRDACGSTHEFAAEHHANFDWSVASDLHFLEFAALKERLVVANLKPVAHVPAELGEKRTCFELFASTGFWETRHKDDLVVVVSDILKRLMMPFDGRDAVPPEPLNDLSFASSICNAVMAGLAGGNRLPALDGDRGRDKILFSDGVLLNLPDLSQRKARPSDRMGVRADATSATWSPTNPSDIFDQVLAFLETRAQGLEDNEQGRKVIESFQQLASDGCELVTLLRRYGSYDWVLWLLRFFTRAASGVDRYPAAVADTSDRFVYDFFPITGDAADEKKVEEMPVETDPAENAEEEKRDPRALEELEVAVDAAQFHDLRMCRAWRFREKSSGRTRQSRNSEQHAELWD